MKKNLLFALVFITTSAIAQFSSNPALNAIVSDSSGTEEAVPICGLNPSFGTTFVSWFNQNASGSYDFSIQALDGNGFNFLPTSGLTVSNYPQGTAIFTYDTKVDHTNSMVTAFQDERSGTLDVVAYRMDQTGTFQWGNAGIILADTAASGGIAPHVGILANNDAVVAWIADGSPKSWISFQRITPAGNLYWTTPKRIIDSSGVAGYSRPQIVPMLNDDFYILYIQQTGSGLPASRMFMQRYNSTGNPVWATAVQISSKLIGFASYPSVVPDGKNGAYIAYASGNPTIPSLNDVYVQHIDENGTLWSVNGTEACTSTLTHRMSPKIRFENNMLNPMVLIKETNGGQDSSGITIQSFDSTGIRLLGPDGFSVTPITASYDEPYDMRCTSDGMIIIYAEGLFGNNQLLATKVDFNGASLWLPSTVSVSSVASNKLRVQLTPVFSSQGSAEQTVAVWEDERIDRGVYTQNINNDGTLGTTVNISTTIYPKINATIYPNPSRTNQYLRIVTESQDKATITLYDATGRMLGTASNVQLVVGTNEFTLNNLFSTSTISSGVYSVAIKGQGTSGRIRLVVE